MLSRLRNSRRSSYRIPSAKVICTMSYCGIYVSYWVTSKGRNELSKQPTKLSFFIRMNLMLGLMCPIKHRKGAPSSFAGTSSLKHAWTKLMPWWCYWLYNSRQEPCAKVKNNPVQWRHYQMDTALQSLSTFRKRPLSCLYCFCDGVVCTKSNSNNDERARFTSALCSMKFQKIPDPK
jgi:hypothetical protein